MVFKYGSNKGDGRGGGGGGVYGVEDGLNSVKGVGVGVPLKEEDCRAPNPTP